MYINSRLNGQLHRRAKEIDDILTIATTTDEEVATTELDPLREWWSYNTQFDARTWRSIFVQYYGIKREATESKGKGNFSLLISLLCAIDSVIQNTILWDYIQWIRDTLWGSHCANYPQWQSERSLGITRNWLGLIIGLLMIQPFVDFSPSEMWSILFGERMLWISSLWRTASRLTRCATSLQNISRSKFHTEENISKNLFKYIKHPEEAPPADEQIAYPTFKRYSHRYHGLDKLMFFGRKWANFWDLFDDGTMKHPHICILLV